MIFKGIYLGNNIINGHLFPNQVFTYMIFKGIYVGNCIIVCILCASIKEVTQYQTVPVNNNLVKYLHHKNSFNYAGRTETFRNI